jgi:hypothetical protein
MERLLSEIEEKIGEKSYAGNTGHCGGYSISK